MISDATKKKNPWMRHVAKVKAMKKNKGKPYSEILKIAKQSYKKK
jgi:hypothetical protein